MPPIYRDATEDEILAWEAKLAEGIAPDVAAADLKITLSSIKRADRERHAKGLDMSRERRRAKVDRRIDELVEKSDPPPAVVTAWAKANHEGYRDKGRIELTGADGGPIEVEQREVSLVAVLAVLIKVGALAQLGEGDAGPLRALAGAQEILPPPADT